MVKSVLAEGMAAEMRESLPWVGEGLRTERMG
jgi:hypothetical protein